MEYFSFYLYIFCRFCTTLVLIEDFTLNKILSSAIVGLFWPLILGVRIFATIIGK